ncbi:hypothetical protein JXA88_15985 [Candidatus Fermentibacteria bacterium]|nr:hypothetical protein [Candidatus Fermentibacteria bacterium]
MELSLRLELRRKAMQTLGLVFVPFGQIGALGLLALAAVEGLHLLRHSHGGVPLWRSVRRLGERGAGRDVGPLLLALGAASVLLVVRGPWAWAILCQPFVADSAAALVGRRCGGVQVPGSGKTLAGSAAFFIVAALGAALAGLPVQASLLLAGAGTMVEAFAPWGLDNLLLPLAGLALWNLL